MIMLDKDYMINHMRNEKNEQDTRNLVLGAACESAEMFQCMMLTDQDFSDWNRFIGVIQQYLENEQYEKIHDVCQTLYAMKKGSDELNGLYMVREDEELCGLYYQIFVGMLDISLFTAKTMYELNGGKVNE